MPYTRTELTLLRLGFRIGEVIDMPYSRAAWYVRAAASEQQQSDDGPSVRDATQEDIDAF